MSLNFRLLLLPVLLLTSISILQARNPIEEGASLEKDYKEFEGIRRQVDYYTPPALTEENLGERVLCHRPMREGQPRMGVEIINLPSNEKLYLAHNNGHGGSGWTLGPGSVQYVIGEIEDAFEGTPQEHSVTVIGAGAIGLMTALELHQKGYKNVSILTKELEGLTSHNAGGLLAPVSMNNAPDVQDLIDKIGVEAYGYYNQIIQGTHPYLTQGAAKVPTYFDDRASSGLEPYVGVCMEPAKDVLLDFMNEHVRPMVRYEGIFMDTFGLMHDLRKAVLRAGIPIQQQEVTDLTSLSSSIVFNCTGLGSAALTGDKNMVPVQGHLILTHGQEGSSKAPLSIHNTMILSYGEDTTSSAGFPMTRSFYQFPKRKKDAIAGEIGVIGGTFIKGANKSIPHPEEFEIMIKGARAFYGLKGNE